MKPVKRSRSAARIMAAVALLLALIGSAGCRTKSFLSTKQEIALGKDAASQVEQQFRVDSTSPDAERVRRIGRSLLPHIDRRDVPYSFKVLDTREINAFSLPGGPVYVDQGLLDFIGNDDDALACVIGHELGHINARHVARMISSQMATNVLIALAIPNPTAQNLAGLADDIFNLKYSRDDEYEADRRGLSYAYHAGYNPEGMIRFFHKMMLLEKRTGAGPPEWMQTHPLTKERIAKAEAIIAHKDYRYGQ
ncbi:MAG: M48 family metalloprotease [Armatimonadetes bacterium]|nr:M48 family metalloprotease [Armatimonadota bacterium]MDE2205517.1 M48 family metalloprotease [Armatimonadota bacterium]